MVLLLSTILFFLCRHCASLSGNSDNFVIEKSNILNTDYLEDQITVTSISECATACVISTDCEAIHFSSSVLTCVKILHSSSILNPLVLGNDTTSPEPQLFIRIDAHTWVPGNDYTYNATLEIWYRVVKEPKADIHGANAACKADGAYLMLIRNQADFDFVVNIQHKFALNRLYLQGSRLSRQHDFVDDLGRPLTFFRWDQAGTGGSGLYLRMNTDFVMETTVGRNSYHYMCQVQLK